MMFRLGSFKAILIGLLINCFTPSVIFAQNEPSDFEKLDELGLSSNRIPLKLSQTGMHITILTSAEIKTLPVQNVNELLSYVSGVDIRQRGPMGVQADIGIRGSSFDQVLVLIDGVRMTDPQTGHHQMNIPLPLTLIDRIEIIRGSAARRYGLNALAGVINIITKLNVDEQISLELFSVTPSESQWNDSLNLGGRLFAVRKWKSWNFIVGIEAMKGKGYRFNSDFEQIRTFFKAQRNIQNGQISLMGGSFNNDFGASYFYAAPRDLNAREKVNTQFLNLQFKQELSSRETVNFSGSSRWNYDHYIFTQFNPSLYQNKHQTIALNIDLNYQLKFEKSFFAMGIEARNERINSTNLGNHSRNILGIYTEYTKNWLPDFSTTIGAYGVHTGFIGFQIYPGLEFQYGLGKNMSIWGNVGTGQRLPTYTDWYYKDPGNLSNPNLKSERAQNTELGIKYQKGKLNAQISAFQKQYFDMIDWIRDNDTLPWSPENVSKLRYRGIESEIRVREFMPVLPEGTEIIWNGCWLTSQDESRTNMLSKNVLNFMNYQQNLRLRLNLWESSSIENTAVYITGTWRLIKRFNQNIYHVLDAKLEYVQGKDWSIYLNLSNIQNTQYKEIASVPMLPRMLGLGIAAKF